MDQSSNPIIKRNYSLDQLKGLACIFMILAHSYDLLSYSNLIVKGIYFLGAMAPVLFFGASGISILLSIKKRELSSIIIFYMIFFVLAFINLAKNGPNYFYFSPYNIFNTIAISGIITAVIIKKSLNYWWLFLIPFLIHYFLLKFDLGDLINTTIRPLFVYPGFGIFPWLSFFLIGAKFFTTKEEKNLIITVVFFSLFLLTGLFLKVPFLDLGLTYKHFMSVSYFFLSLSLFGFIYCLFTYSNITLPILNFFGKNSFLFWYTHLLIINVISFKSQPIIIWLLVLLLTTITMNICLWLNKYIVNITNNWYFWLGTIGTIFVGLYIPEKVVSPLFFTMGIVVSINYHNLFNLIDIHKIKLIKSLE